MIFEWNKTVFLLTGSLVMLLLHSALLASEIRRFDLTENFDVDPVIRKRAVRFVTENFSEVDNEYTRNHLKAGLFAYNDNGNRWEFFEDQNLYVSGWKCDHINKWTHAYTIGKVYDPQSYKTKSIFATHKDYKDLSLKTKAKVQEDFMMRNIQILDEFPYASYAHTEQAHLSFLQNSKEKEYLYNYSNFLMLYYSTKEMCANCTGTFSSLLEEDMLTGLVYRFNGSREILEKSPMKSEDSFNMFFIGLNDKYNLSSSIDTSAKNHMYHTTVNKCGDSFWS